MTEFRFRLVDLEKILGRVGRDSGGHVPESTKEDLGDPKQRIAARSILPTVRRAQEEDGQWHQHDTPGDPKPEGPPPAILKICEKCERHQLAYVAKDKEPIEEGGLLGLCPELVAPQGCEARLVGPVPDRGNVQCREQEGFKGARKCICVLLERYRHTH